LHAGLLAAHLAGELTLGTYVLDQDSQAGYVVLDADDGAGEERLARLAAALEGEGVPGYLEQSRRGAHLWFFFAERVSGKDARAFGQGVIERHQLDDVELFPKQDQLGSGPGSLIRLPFGRHQLTGRLYGFVTPSGERLAPTIRQQITLLRSPEVVSHYGFAAYQSVAGLTIEVKERELAALPAETVSDRIKQAVTVLEFVSQYVDLKPTASGALGLCPFHDDHHPSFGVNDEANFWHCFAGCGGGSVVDFWMKYRDVDFASAVGELAGVLL
jgi:hypothetical protein